LLFSSNFHGQDFFFSIMVDNLENHPTDMLPAQISTVNSTESGEFGEPIALPERRTRGDTIATSYPPVILAEAAKTFTSPWPELYPLPPDAQLFQDLEELANSQPDSVRDSFENRKLRIRQEQEPTGSDSLYLNSIHNFQLVLQEVMAARHLEDRWKKIEADHDALVSLNASLSKELAELKERFSKHLVRTSEILKAKDTLQQKIAQDFGRLVNNSMNIVGHRDNKQDPQLAVRATEVQPSAKLWKKPVTTISTLDQIKSLELESACQKLRHEKIEQHHAAEITAAANVTAVLLGRISELESSQYCPLCSTAEENAMTTFELDLKVTQRSMDIVNISQGKRKVCRLDDIAYQPTIKMVEVWTDGEMKISDESKQIIFSIVPIYPSNMGNFFLMWNRFIISLAQRFLPGMRCSIGRKQGQTDRG
jgi:hypothetical protein